MPIGDSVRCGHRFSFQANVQQASAVSELVQEIRENLSSQRGSGRRAFPYPGPYCTAFTSSGTDAGLHFTCDHCRVVSDVPIKWRTLRAGTEMAKLNDELSVLSQCDGIPTRLPH